MKVPVILFLVGLAAGGAVAEERPPNVVYIMSDELAYYELGHMGNPYIKTPRIDRMAAEGLRFTRAYAGAPVCAPLRCNLMTGKHAGHASVRANGGGTPLRAGEETIASLLRARGYATGGFGKWGCGGRDSTGVPEEHGFDTFFGYYDQVHAHTFYPPYLIHNSEEVPLEGNVGGRKGETYSHYEIMDRGLEFIRENRERPFFCYLPITPPHGMYDIPADDPAWDLYKGEAWLDDDSVPQDAKNYAAMVSLVDRNVGEVIDLLKELGLEENTIVFFTGDNGGQDRFRNAERPRGFFGPNVDPKTGVEFRGGKGNLYEGGLRIPFLVRWPGKIEAGRVSDLMFYQPDILPTLSSLCGAAIPKDVDGLSILPTLLNEGQRKQHGFLYWEFGNQVAVRKGKWKAIQNRRDNTWALYDIDADVSETTDVAAANAGVVKQLAKLAEASHEPVQEGTYADPKQERHQRDRWAKWGTSPDRPASKPKKSNNPNKPKRKANVIKAEGLIPSGKISVTSVSSDNPGNGKVAANAVDGDPHTVWHTGFSTGVKEHPHEIVLDLGADYVVDRVHYLARQDNGWNGAFGKTEIFVAGAADGFGDEATASVAFEKSRQAQTAALGRGVKGRFVKLRVLSGSAGGPWASAAEIGVSGKRVE